MHDVVVSADEFRLLLALVDHNHKGDVTLAMFHQLMEMTGEIAALLSLSLSLSLLHRQTLHIEIYSACLQNRR
jgi:hypothetical protein